MSKICGELCLQIGVKLLRLQLLGDIDVCGEHFIECGMLNFTNHGFVGNLGPATKHEAILIELEVKQFALLNIQSLNG